MDPTGSMCPGKQFNCDFVSVRRRLASEGQSVERSIGPGGDGLTFISYASPGVVLHEKDYQIYFYVRLVPESEEDLAGIFETDKCLEMGRHRFHETAAKQLEVQRIVGLERYPRRANAA